MMAELWLAMSLLSMQTPLAVATLSTTTTAVQDTSSATDFELKEEQDRLRISLRGTPIVDFVFRDERVLRPYFANARLVSGPQVTRNHPPVKDVDAVDHDTMHPGIWLGFGDISGQDFWRNKGTMEHIRFVTAPTTADGQLRFATECRLKSSTGEPLCLMTNEYTLQERPNGWRLVWSATFRADLRPIVFGDQEEMGFGARIATPFTEKNGGVIRSSAGKQTAKETWGQPAHWCDYSGSGPTSGGIMLMASDKNFRESWWHNRDYGVFVANPFGREAMKQGTRSAITIAQGETLRLTFGALVHDHREFDPALEFQAFKQTTEAAPQTKPNIILIYSDDHGWSDLGSQDADKDIRTPHLDQLARDGVRFTRGYVSAPQCMPSRCGVITGRYQQRFGVEDNSRGPLPLSELTIAERLRPAGYVSGFVGKSHFDIGGEKGQARDLRILPDHLPHHQGFDEYFRGELKDYYASHGLDGTPFADAPRRVSDPRFRVVVQTEAALSFLRRRVAKPEQPWFLYLAWYAPHVPLESPEPWFSQTSESLPLKRRQALAMIAAMDDGLGRLRAQLKEMRQDQNTLIFFIGDNGAPLGNAWNGSSNRPLVGQKGMLSEGGIRVPFVAAWPGHWPAGVAYDHPVMNLDVAATAVALAGQPHDEKLDGVDLAPFVTGGNRAAPHDRLFWRWASQAAVLEMPYKLIRLGNRPSLLFDVTQPDGENLERDLAARHPEIAERLEQRLQAWAAELHPPGLSTDDSAFSRRHEELFAEHRLIAAVPPERSASTTAPRAGEEGGVQGWIARNGKLAVEDGALVLTPEADLPKNARPFVTNSHLDLAGPVTATLRVRSKDAGQGRATITWRTKQESFAAHQSADFAWPTGAEWQEVRVQLPEKSRVIHLRITPPKAATGIEIQSIQLSGEKGAARNFRFDSK